MGVLSEYIEQKIEADVRSKGLLIWLDKKGDYTALVDNLVERYKSRKLQIPVFAFRGSFLDLMAESQSVLSGKDLPKCIIHLPGFSEDEVVNTPIFEAYCAGQRWRIALETVVKECAVGRFTPNQITFMLSEEAKTLEKLEMVFQDHVDTALEIKPLLNKYGEEGIIIKFLEDPQKILTDLAVAPESRYPLLADYFHTLLGFDNDWKNTWLNGNNTQLAEDFSDALMAWLLCVEYVSDMSIEPPSQRLQRLKSIGLEYKTRVGKILEKFRSNNPQQYIKLALHVETSLFESEINLSPDVLGHLDTFRFEADIFLRSALDKLAISDWEQAQHLSRTRLPGRKCVDISQTFWLVNDLERQWLWEWIDTASQLGTEITKHAKMAKPKLSSLESMMNEYAKEGWQLDSLHRRFTVLTERLSTGNSSLEFKQFYEIRKMLIHLYRVHIDAQCREWNNTCELYGFLGPVETRQRNFYQQWVQPRIDSKQKIAIVLVDALRYELAKELESLITEDNWSFCSLVPNLAELPTITSVGMNVLLSPNINSDLEPLIDSKKGTVTGFKSGQRNIIDPASRLAALKESSGLNCAWLDLELFLKEDTTEVKKASANQVLVLANRALDELGEIGALDYGIDYFKRGLANIKRALWKLRDYGFSQVLITADHGFLLGDEFLESGKATRLDTVDRRYAIDTHRTGENLVATTFTSLHYKTDQADRALIFERSTHLLNNRTCNGFYHGGNSPQERIIPVFALSNTRSSGQKGICYRLKIEPQADLLGHHRIRISLSCDELFVQSKVALHMQADEGVGIRIVEGIGADITGDLIGVEISSPCEILFKLQGNIPRSKIKFVAGSTGFELLGADCIDYFDVEMSANQYRKVSSPEQPLNKATFVIPDEIPSDFHTALAHLHKHGSLTEQFLVNTLGTDGMGPRKARRFAMAIDSWKTILPFAIKIELTPEGKVYRIDN